MRTRGHWTLRGGLLVLGLAVLALSALAGPVGPPTAQAAPGELIATVTVPAPHCVPAPGCGELGVGGTFDGTRYIYVNFDDVSGIGTLHIMTPPPGDGVGALVDSKAIVDGAGDPVAVSAIAWDPGRGKLWGAYANNVYLIDISGPGDAVATFQFNPNVGGYDLIDGLAYDASDDTLYHSPDVDCNVYQFSPLGTLMNTVTPENAAGEQDCSVSGVVVGSANSLYIGRNGASEIRRVDYSSGAFVSGFATTAGRVEDLTCDPVTYAPREAVLAKDSYNNLYEAFEVEPGTCPLQGNPNIEKDPPLANLWLCNIPGAPGCDNKESGVEEVNLDVYLDQPVTSTSPKGEPQSIGSFEFEVRYDSKLLIVDWEPGELAALMTCGKIRQENALQIACVTKGKPADAPSGPGVLATLRVRATADVYSILIANQENGIATQLINQDCQLSDLQGHPIKTDVCGDAAITIRYLEGDIHADCAVDVTDQQQIAFRWGSRLGNLLYNSRMDLEPSTPKKGDGDIDAKDLQFVYGRHGSTCKSPWPAQEPVDPKTKPQPPNGNG